MTRPNAYIGSALERIEDARLLTGKAAYCRRPQPRGLLHAAILRSPCAHGLIRNIDAAAALELSGVMAVITARDIGEVPIIPIRQHSVPEGEPYRQPAIARDKVRYVGEPVAVIIAAEPAIAEDALELVRLDIDELPRAADHLVSARDETLLFEETGTNRAAVFSARMGDAGAAFAAADYTRRERLSVQRHTAFPMETRGLLAEWDAARSRMALYRRHQGAVLQSANSGGHARPWMKPPSI